MHLHFTQLSRWPSYLLLVLVVLSGNWPVSLAAKEKGVSQYIIVNCKPGLDSGREHIAAETFSEVKSALPNQPGAKRRVGLGFIFSYFRASDELVIASLRRVLESSAETDTPVYIQLDGEQWWDARPDLWNWWDAAQPGFNPKNRNNVEWSGWSPDDALKVAWRNWGRQWRVRPPPNLMSPCYREACSEKMRILIPIVLEWWKALPAQKKDLLVGIKVGWESSIGVNAWYYPNGNALLDQPRENDPATGLDGQAPPARGAAQIGYAAVKTAGIRTNGPITEADLAKVARRHLEGLSREAAKLGVPREKLFTHGVGWKDDELLYQAPVNKFSCPGWSFYKHAADPHGDVGVQKALKKSDAPFWAATEWLLQKAHRTEPWREALENTLSDPRCRLVCIYNWDTIQESEPVLQAIRETVAASKPSR